MKSWARWYRPTLALACAGVAALALMWAAGASGAPASEHVQAARGQDTERPRGQDTERPRGEDGKWPRGDDSERPRGHDRRA